MFQHWQFICSTANAAPAFVGSHNFWLLSLSVVIAIIAAYGALTLAARLPLMEETAQRRNWLGLGAVAMGGGIWTMHFVGMMSFGLPVPVGYSLTWTAVSVLPAIAASAVALTVIGRAQLDWPRLVAGGVLMGAGIGLMHYLGMAAMRGDFTMAYDPWLFTLSVVVAVVLAMVALYVRQAISRWEDGSSRHWSVAAGAVAMGGAVAGMHYTAMAAVHFWPQNAGPIFGGGELVLMDQAVLGSIVSVAAVLVTAATVVAAATDHHWRTAQRLRHEIVDRAAAEAALRHKNAALERSMSDLESFAYVASHDLREPLRAISGHLTLLERRLGPNLGPEDRESLHYATTGAKHLDRMVLDLLDYTQAGRSGGEESGFVDCAAAAQAAIDSLATTIADTGARIELAADLPIMPGVKADMTRLFAILIGNAIKFRDPDRAPLIRIWADRVGENWRFHVADNGIGIPDKHDYRQRVFRLFHRLHGRDAFGGGSGVGLAICKKIVDTHGGNIAIETSEDGQGATFVITLPGKS